MNRISWTKMALSSSWSLIGIERFRMLGGGGGGGGGGQFPAGTIL